MATLCEPSCLSLSSATSIPVALKKCMTHFTSLGLRSIISKIRTDQMQNQSQGSDRTRRLSPDSSLTQGATNSHPLDLNQTQP